MIHFSERYFSSSDERGTKKKSESPTVSEVYYEVHMTRVLHTARISDIDSVMFVNRIRSMASFELGKK